MSFPRKRESSKSSPYFSRFRLRGRNDIKRVSPNFIKFFTDLRFTHMRNLQVARR
jgi:hypothetical protein